MKKITYLCCVALIYMMSINANAQTVRINGQTNPAPVGVCKGDSLMLTADYGTGQFTTVQWVKTPGSPPWTSTNNPIWTNDTIGNITYSVYLYNGAIYLGMTSITVTIKPLPNGIIVGPTNCYNDQRQFNVINLTGVSPWTIKVYDDPAMTTMLGMQATSLPNNPGMTFNFLPPATVGRDFYFTIVSANGCIKK